MTTKNDGNAYAEWRNFSRTYAPRNSLHRGQWVLPWSLPSMDVSFSFSSAKATPPPPRRPRVGSSSGQVMPPPPPPAEPEIEDKYTGDRPHNLVIDLGEPFTVDQLRCQLTCGQLYVKINVQKTADPR